MPGCGERRLHKLMNSGELESVLEGASRRVVASSLYDLICKRAANSHPIGRSAVKVHDGREGLRRSHREAQASKEAKAAARV
jgi:hypothetical protein